MSNGLKNSDHEANQSIDCTHRLIWYLFDGQYVSIRGLRRELIVWTFPSRLLLNAIFIAYCPHGRASGGGGGGGPTTTILKNLQHPNASKF